MYLNKFFIDFSFGLEKNTCPIFWQILVLLCLKLLPYLFPALGPRCLDWSHLNHWGAELPWILTLALINSIPVHSTNMQAVSARWLPHPSHSRHNEKCDMVPWECELLFWVNGKFIGKVRIWIKSNEIPKGFPHGGSHWFHSTAPGSEFHWDHFGQNWGLGM